MGPAARSRLPGPGRRRGANGTRRPESRRIAPSLPGRDDERRRCRRRPDRRDRDQAGRGRLRALPCRKTGICQCNQWDSPKFPIMDIMQRLNDINDLGRPRDSACSTWQSTPLPHPHFHRPPRSRKSAWSAPGSIHAAQRPGHTPGPAGGKNRKNRKNRRKMCSIGKVMWP